MRRARGDAGQVGGFEALPFGVLIFVLGALLVTNAWAVIDAKLAATAAAREAARVFVESPDAASAESLCRRGGPRRAESAWPQSLPCHGARRGGAFLRCQLVTFEVTYSVPTLTLPFVGGWGDGLRVTARHGEIVDPYRNGPDGEADCA